MSYFLRGLPFGVTFETTFTLDMLNEMIEITASLPVRSTLEIIHIENFSLLNCKNRAHYLTFKKT